MVSEPPLPPGNAARPPRASGCGARACLVGCLLPVVAAVIASVVLEPALQRRWMEWRAENPWAEALPGLVAAFRNADGGGAEDAEGAEDEEGAHDPGGGRPARAREGSDDKTALPSDLPVWSRPKAETFSVGEGHAAAYQRVSQPSDSVLRYFRRAMPAQGWRLDAERTGAGGVLLIYRKSDRLARVEIVADSGGTDVWLRSRRVER